MINARVPLVAILLLSFIQPANADPDSRVRCTHPRLMSGLIEGQRHSATFRDLVSRVQASNLIVHAEPAIADFPSDGGLQFVGATAGHRYLRITMRTDLPTRELVGLFGHELMHAVEVAGEPGVIDEASFRRFYEDIGRRGHASDRVTFDTRAAVQAGQQVALEFAQFTASR